MKRQKKNLNFFLQVARRQSSRNIFSTFSTTSPVKMRLRIVKEEKKRTRKAIKKESQREEQEPPPGSPPLGTPPRHR